MILIMVRIGATRAKNLKEYFIDFLLPPIKVSERSKSKRINLTVTNPTPQPFNLFTHTPQIRCYSNYLGRCDDHLVLRVQKIITFSKHSRGKAYFLKAFNLLRF